MHMPIENRIEALSFCSQNPLGSRSFARWFPFCFALCVSLLLAGPLSASDPGKLAWKEQRGSMRAAEVGVVVWKEQPFHDDASSKAFAYDRIKQDGQITWFYNGVKGLSFEKHQIFQQIKFPQWPVGEIVEQVDFESLKYQLSELEAFATRYPNAAGYLDGMIGSMRDAVGHFESGKVFFAGNWITRDQYKQHTLNRDETLRNYALERKELEKKQLERDREKEKLQQAEYKEQSKFILIASGAWLLLLLVALLIKSRGLVSILILALIVAAGWFTYKASGFGWTKDFLRAAKELPSYLPLLKE